MKISVVMSIFNAMCYLKFSLESIYDFADEIVITDGLIEQFNKDKSVESNNGSSNDGTIECIKSFPDPDKKINLTCSKRWNCEKTKRQHIVTRASGDWIMTVDSDEVYKRKDLDFVRDTIKKNPDIYSIWPTHYRFCGDFQHYYPWLGAVFQKKFKGCKLYGLREMWFPGKKVYKYPWNICKNVSEPEFKKHVWRPANSEIICYHYSNVCSKNKAHRKKLISVGLGHNMKDWNKRQFGEGLDQKGYEKIRNIVEFDGEHPEVMKKHRYYKQPPEWMEKK